MYCGRNLKAMQELSQAGGAAPPLGNKVSSSTPFDTRSGYNIGYPKEIPERIQAVLDLYISMIISTMPGGRGRPLWRRQLQSDWDRPDWLQLKQKGLVLKMTTDPPNSSKFR